MALTMTRTRTQTTLTRLAMLIANVHGELEFVEGLLRGAGQGQGSEGVKGEVRARLEARRVKLVADRDALYATVRQFDAEIEPAGIGSAEAWQKRLSTRRSLTRKSLVVGYLRFI
jgi:hypothetical protein